MKRLFRLPSSVFSNVIRVLVFTLFGLVTLGQLERIELSQGRALYLHEIVLVVLLLVTSVFFRKKMSVKCEVFAALRIFDLWVICTIILGFFFERAQIITPLLYLARVNAYILFGAVLYLGKKLHAVSHDFLQWLSYGSVGVIAILGWLQYIFIPDTRSLVFLGWDDHYLRLIGTLFDPGFTGIVLALGALLIEARLFKEKGKGIGFALLQWIWLLSVSALLFTYSRASFLAFVVGAFFLFLRQQKKAHLVVILFFLFSILCLPRPRSEGTRLERTASITARITTVQSGVTGVSPLEFFVGKGWYSLKESSPRVMAGSRVPSHTSAPENSYIFLFSSLGIVGVLLFIWFVWSVVRFSSPSTEVLVVLLAVGTHAFFSNTLFYPFVLLYVAATVGLYAR